MPASVTFDHYEVLTRDDGSLFELGRGAMGITYKAFDTNLRMPVALKVINGNYLDSDVARQRFIREARSAAKLRHRHVASVFHLGTEGDAYFYAMEFIDGETVDALIKRQGPLKPALALQITDQVARALNAAQPHGLVHRDIKPANLMLVREDDEIVVKVIDFGLAKSSVGGEEDNATLSIGGFVGTPHFASPEQLEEKEIDVRSDIYSLGVTLWYMLAGQTPFAGSMAQVMSQHLSKPPPFEKIDRLPSRVAALLRRMLEKDPALRPQTPSELRREIEVCLETLGGEAPLSSIEIAEEDQDFATLLDDSSLRVGETHFEVGAMIAGRYRILESLGEGNTGRLFKAEQTESKQLVRLLVLHRELVEDRNSYAQIEREVEKVAPVAHPNLLKVHALETVGTASFLVLEWTQGCTLLELLRVRRELEAEEVLRFLPQAADGIDHALNAGLKRLDLALHQVFVHFDHGVVGKDALLREPLEKWPPFTLKLNPLGITREVSLSETWAGGQTMVGGHTPHAAESADVRARCLQALGAITYELLGGTLSPLALTASGSFRYTPLATLSEEGNNVVRRALDPSLSYPTAYEFYRSLHELHGTQAKRHEARPPATFSHAARSTAPLPPPLPGRTPVASRPRFPIAFFSGIATVGVIGAIIYFI
ncbi:MAG TPA: protein kinase, partial [Chthoniobacteraceae bacterium]